MKSNNLSRYLLQAGLAIVFIYAGIDSFREPSAWVHFIPEPATKIFDQKLLLDGFSIFQFVMAALILWPRTAFYGAVLAAVTLFGITAVNIAEFLVVFRDLGLGFMAAALAAQTSPTTLFRRKH